MFDLKAMLRKRTAALLVCALALAACGFGVHGVCAERQRQRELLRERTQCAQNLAEALELLRAGREAYLAAAQDVRNGKNAYDTQKDLVRIAKDAVDRHRAALAKAQAAGTLTGDALAEAQSELELQLADFSAREGELAQYEALLTKVEAYEKEKARARELLETLRGDARIQKKLEAGMGPVAAAAAGLAEEAAALRRRFYAAIALFAGLGGTAVAVLCRALRGARTAQSRRPQSSV